MAPVPWQIHKLSRDALEQVSTHQSKQLEGVQTPNPHDDLYGLDLMEAVEKYNRTAASVAASLDFDVIHCHDWMTFGAGIIAKQISGKPLVCQVHATEFDRCPGYGNREVHEIEQAGCLVADRVIAVSSYTKKLLVDRYGVSDNKIEIVHNGIELQPDVPSPQPVHSDQPPRILFLGRVTYQKGPNYFIEAAKKVLQVRPDARFVIAGKGDMLDYIKARAGELAILNNLEFVGLLTPEEVQRIYRSVDCFVLSSVSEPFGLTVLEALSQRLPVILSRQSGVSEVLRHVLRYDYWDVDRLASLILSVVSYSPLASELREKGIDDLHPVSWDRSAERIHGIYAGAVGKI
jgi:glycosyltransferase involved in cell wall biosynthesis